MQNCNRLMLVQRHEWLPGLSEESIWAGNKLVPCHQPDPNGQGCWWHKGHPAGAVFDATAPHKAD